MATYTPKRLVGPSALSTSLTDVYTTASTGAVAKQFIFTNTSNAAVTLFAHVSNGGTAPSGIAGAIVHTLSVGPYSQIIWTADVPLNSGDRIWVKAGTGSVVNVTVTGIEIA